MRRAILIPLILVMIGSSRGLAGIPAGSGRPADEELDALLDKISDRMVIEEEYTDFEVVEGEDTAQPL